MVIVDKYCRIPPLRTRAFDPGAFRPPGGDPRAARTRYIRRQLIVGRRLAAGYPNGMRPKYRNPRLRYYYFCFLKTNGRHVGILLTASM